MRAYYRRYQGRSLSLVIVLSVLCGIYFPHCFSQLTFISAAFINLLKLCALPIIVTSLILSIGSLTKLHDLQQVVVKAIVYIIATEIIAVSIGLLVFNIVDSGRQLDAAALFGRLATTKPPAIAHFTQEQMVNFLLPSNFFQALVNYEVLPVVIISILLGISCLVCAREANPFLEVLISIRVVFLNLLNGVMYLNYRF